MLPLMSQLPGVAIGAAGSTTGSGVVIVGGGAADGLR